MGRQACQSMATRLSPFTRAAGPTPASAPLAHPHSCRRMAATTRCPARSGRADRSCDEARAFDGVEGGWGTVPSASKEIQTCVPLCLSSAKCPRLKKPLSPRRPEARRRREWHPAMRARTAAAQAAQVPVIARISSCDKSSVGQNNAGPNRRKRFRLGTRPVNSRHVACSSSKVRDHHIVQGMLTDGGAGDDGEGNAEESAGREHFSVRPPFRI